jgi:hypothetical protein
MVESFLRCSVPSRLRHDSDFPTIVQRRNRPLRSPNIHVKCQKRHQNPLYLPTCYDRVVRGAIRNFGNLSVNEIAVGGNYHVSGARQDQRGLSRLHKLSKNGCVQEARTLLGRFCQRLRIRMPTFITGIPKALGFRRLLLRDLGEKL